MCQTSQLVEHHLVALPEFEVQGPSLFLRAWLNADEALLDVAVVNLWALMLALQSLETLPYD